MDGISPVPEAQQEASQQAYVDPHRDAMQAEVDRLLHALEPRTERHVAILACEHEMHLAERVHREIRDAGLDSRIVVIGAGYPGALPFNSGRLVELVREQRFVPWIVETPKNEPWYRRHATPARGKGRKY